MFKSYLVISINNLIKNKLYSTINIIGLSVGLVACILIALYVQDETSYDKHWQQADRIYRVNKSIDFTGGTFEKGIHSSILALPALKNYFQDEIEYGTRIFSAPMVFQIGTTPIDETLLYIDIDYFSMFSLELLAGSFEETLAGPGRIALSEQTAIKFFGSNGNEVIGQSLPADLGAFKLDYLVTAIYKTPPENSILAPTALSLLSDEEFSGTGIDDWFAQMTETMLQLSPLVDLEKFSVRLESFIDQNIDISSLAAGPNVAASDRVLYELQNITNIHLNSPFDQSRAGGSLEIVQAFTIISLLVLLIACANFVILTTAKATQRAKEVAMRKVHGAKRYQLIIQFLGESFVLVLFALIIALALAELLLPFFESLVGKNFDINYAKPATYLTLLALLFTVGFGGGMYPALILSQFRPATTLKSNRSAETKSSRTLRSILVIFQFGVSIILIVATTVVFLQVRYSSNRDPGFNSDNLLLINGIANNAVINANRDTLKLELTNLPNVSQAGYSGFAPMQGGYNIISYMRKDQLELASRAMLPTFKVGSDFFETFQIPLISGRYFEDGRDQELEYAQGKVQTFDQDSINVNAILNASAIRQLGFNSAEEAIGSSLGSSTEVNSTRADVVNLNIIGVVEDSQFASLRTLPRPEIYILSPDGLNTLALRFQGDPQAILRDVENTLSLLTSDEILQTSFVEQSIAEQFDQENNEAYILIYFSLFAVFIACLGLFGSTSFSVERRIKEIGLRKVMGAKVKDIVSLLLWQFSIPVLIANLIAWPIAIWEMMSWLERFPYRIDTWLLVPICFAAGLLALLITALTVSSNTTRVARSNPIKALRYE